jgi:hypothetical protein
MSDVVARTETTLVDGWLRVTLMVRSALLDPLDTTVSPMLTVVSLARAEVIWPINIAVVRSNASGDFLLCRVFIRPLI